MAWRAASRDKIIDWWICQKFAILTLSFSLGIWLGKHNGDNKRATVAVQQCSGSFRNFLATSVSFVKTFPEESHRDVIRKRKNNQGSKRPENYANIAILLLLLLICQAVSNSRRNLFIGIYMQFLKPIQIVVRNPFHWVLSSVK